MVFPFLIGAAAGRIKAEFLSICESSGQVITVSSSELTLAVL